MRTFAVSVVALYVAAVLEFGVANRVMIFGGKPDFLLTTVAILSLLQSRAGATLCGFLGGVLKGAIVGANLTHYVITRTLTGFILAWTRNIRVEWRLPLVILATGLSTIVAQTLFMLLAAPPNLVAFMLDTIRTAVYDSLLAAILYPVIQWAMGPTMQRTRYERNL